MSQALIDRAEFVLTGQDSQRHDVGTVTIHLRKPAWWNETFEKVDARDFNIWQESGYSPRLVPFDMQADYSQWIQRAERKLADDEEWDYRHGRG